MPRTKINMWKIVKINKYFFANYKNLLTKYIIYEIQRLTENLTKNYKHHKNEYIKNLKYLNLINTVNPNWLRNFLPNLIVLMKIQKKVKNVLFN